MVLKGAATMIVRLSRGILSHPLKSIHVPRVYEIPKINKSPQVYTEGPLRYYLFPSVYRSFFTHYGPSIGRYHQNLSYLLPFRAALNEIKRRLFFAAPASSRFALNLLGYSLLTESSFNPIHIDKSINQIGDLLSKTTTVDSFNNDNEKYTRASLDDFELGRLLGYGCNAAVYEARLRSSTSEGTSPIQTNFIHNDDNNTESDIEILSRQSSNISSIYDETCEHLDNEQQLNDLTLREVRYRALTNLNNSSNVESDILPAGKFNLAIKMLFNYGIQSNAEALEKAMDKELLPLRKCSYHPNIVRMYSCFVDTFPLLHEAQEYYPMAIPSSLSPDGYGRNKTLFIVMRKYDLTLSEYIRLNKPTHDERLVLFAQLLEALLYLKHRSIVHRDLKSDNLLVCNLTGELVLADFGCALYHPPNLKVPYTTDEICKGGNLALMAPEIVACQPGPKSFLDYNKADLWASGTLCYEFFSQPNPFFHGTFRQETYNDQQLPSLSPLASRTIENLVHSMLRKNPKERPSISRVSDCIHLYLWFQSTALTMTKNEFYQTYMWTALETLFNKRTLSFVELNLKKLFFQRQSSQSLYDAQSYLNQLSMYI
ncbi:unnamed protein product [Adineta steineri]|uniref:non-specific serine/threonine protein kinase n=1 Tax=Adineta steineri TaxID=433720 RepID=A0A814JSY1_9BILA|nr:unnamed protein product [Adineta steineri]CAF3544600.1 unnamed protein product [Adineta steineri]